MALRPSTITKRAVEAFCAAPHRAHTVGAGWYEEAEREMRRIAAAGPSGFGQSAAAGVFAALSPRTQWSVNLKGAYAMAIAADIGFDAPPAVGLGISRARAWAIAQGANPNSVLSGNKVRAFWRNLSGDPNPVTIDIWMARSVGEPEEKIASRYPLLEQAFQAAAKEVDVTPRTLQAVVWFATRGFRPDDPNYGQGATA